MAKKSHVQILIELYLIFKVGLPVPTDKRIRIAQTRVSNSTLSKKWSVEVDDKTSYFDMLPSERLARPNCILNNYFSFILPFKRVPFKRGWR